MSDPTKIKKVLQWYAMGGGPISYYDAGNPDMCHYSNGTYCYTPIVGNAQASMMGQSVLIQHGCCVPGSCVGDDAIKVVQKNMYCYQGFNLTYNKYMYKGMGHIENTCAPLPRNWKSFGPICVMVIFGVFLFLVIVASAIQQRITQSEWRKRRFGNFHSHSSSHFSSHPKNMLQTYLYCFSIQRIWNAFVRRRPTDKSQFNFLDGIRVGSMSWVIYGHAFVFFMSTGVSNLPTAFPVDPTKSYDYVANRWYMLMAEYGFYSVDSFFWLSGFLATFSIVRQVTKYGHKAVRFCYLWIPVSYLARILRIVPMMMFITAIQWQIADQLPYGYHVTSRSTNSDACDRNWYKILFFYANLEKDQSAMSCMGHLWYIQCDMQFFLVLPFLVLAFQWKKMVGMMLSLVPLFISVSKRIYFAVEYEFQANLIYPPAYQPPHPDKATFADSYFKPIPRAATYFVGVFTMFLILTLQQKGQKVGNVRTKFTISEFSYFVLMCAAGFILLSLVFWPHSDIKNGPQHRWSIPSNQWYYALSRPAWGVGLSVLAFAFTFRNTFRTGRVSMVQTVLSAEIWQPMGKLTYTMYLTHLVIFMWWIGDLAMPQYYTFWYVFFIFAGIWVITFSISVILWFVMEQPMATMVSLFVQFLNRFGKRVSPHEVGSKYSINSQDAKKKSFNESLLSTADTQRSSREVVEESDVITITKGSMGDHYVA
eukprot:163718_1